MNEPAPPNRPARRHLSGDHFVPPHMALDGWKATWLVCAVPLGTALIVVG